MMGNAGLFGAWREGETRDRRDGGWECLRGSCLGSAVAVVY